MDHIETDKAFDEKFFARNGEMKVETFLDVKQFIHHRIELEVEKAVSKNKKYIGKLLSMISTKQQLLDLIDSLNK